MKTAIVILFISIISMSVSLPLIGEKLKYEWFHNVQIVEKEKIEADKSIWYRTVRFVGKILLLYGLLLLLVSMFFMTIKFDPFSKKLILFVTTVLPVIIGIVMTILYVNKVTKEVMGKITVF